MKSKLLIAAFTIASIALTSCGGSTETKSEAKADSSSAMKSDSLLAAGEKIIYQCPMHPEEKSDKPGTCPKCGMDLEKVIVKDTVK